MNPRTLAAIKRAREKRECEDERKFVDWARDEGCVCLKLNVRGNRDWPDQWVVGDMDDMLIEFKRAGKKPTPKQYELHERLRRCKFVVSVDNFEEAKKFALAARLMLRWR